MKKVTFMTTLLILALTGLQVSADDVKPSIKKAKDSPVIKEIDLRPEFGPIRDQGNMGFCYAFATADLLSYWLNTEGGFKSDPNKDTRKAENMVSALAYALSYNNKARQDLLKLLSVTKHVSKTKLEAINKQYEEEIANNRAVIESIISAKQTTNSKNEPSIVRRGNAIYDNLLEQLALQEKIDLDNSLDEAILNLNKYTAYSQTIKSVINNPKWLSEPEGGVLDYSVDVSKQGICFEKDIPSKMTTTVNTPSFVSGKETEWLFNYPSMFLKGIYSTKQNEGAKGKCKKQVNLAKTLFPTMKEGLLSRLLKKSAKEESYDMVAKVLSKACYSYRKINVPLPSIETSYVLPNDKESGKQALELISSLLEQGIPVYIGYDSRVLNVDLSWFKDEIRPAHSSLLIGQKQNKTTGKLEYILRNSWGVNSCKESLLAYISISKEQQEAFARELDNTISSCACEHEADETAIAKCEDNAIKNYEDQFSKAQEAGIAPYKCEEGYYIIDAELLVNVTNLISWFAKNSKWM